MYDSTAWLSTSSPADAATAGGSVRVLSGSISPSTGLSRRWAMPVFAFISTRSKIDTPVVSLVNLTIPGLGTFSAHVVIDGKKYAGTWKHGKAGGHMFGVIEKLKE